MLVSIAPPRTPECCVALWRQRAIGCFWHTLPPTSKEVHGLLCDRNKHFPEGVWCHSRVVGGGVVVVN